MQRVYVFAFYRLAAALEPLKPIITGSAKFSDVFLPLVTARDQIQDLLDNTIIPVRVCWNAGTELIRAITTVVPDDFSKAMEKDQQNVGLVLTWMQAYNITEGIKKFETVLAEELRLVDTYSVSRKGVYSTSDLIDSADALFPEVIRKRLPSKAVADIRQAGKCLAFETATAAGFHIFRTIESVMAEYYQRVVGKPMATRMRNWGTYIRAMRQSGIGDERILRMLETHQGQLPQPDHPSRRDDDLG